jgi:hypothetical protein
MDSSGAVVPGASITITNPENGLTRKVDANQNGYYQITFLPPGSYSLRVEDKGFSTMVQKINILVNQIATLNFTLKPGSPAEVVEVTAEAPLIETTRSDVGGSVTPTEVRDLPIVDRNFSGLMMLIPGVRPAQGFDPTKTRSGNISVNGNDGRSFDYNVDGGDNKDNVIGGIVQNYTMEGIQEFNVQTDHYTAESGRTVGGVVNVVSKSGTNSLHGTAFGLFQNSALNKNDFFTLQTCRDSGISASDCRKPLFHRYHFGGSIGGPIKKDKLFFFGAYEHKREPGSIAVDPTSFSELSLFPLAQPITTLPFPYKDHLLTVKVDYHVSDKQNMFFRYARERWINPNDQLGNPFVADLSQSNSDTNQFHDFVIQDNYVFSSTKVNSLNLHYGYFANTILGSPGRTFTLPVAGGGTVTNPEVCFNPSPGCGGGSPEIGQNVNVPQETLIGKYQLRDDFSWVHGRHSMKVGFNGMYLYQFGGFFFFGANGYQVTFWDDPSVILGHPAQYPQGFATPGAVQEILFNGGSGSTNQNPKPWAIGLYYQDDFKVTPRLTLNLGIRWDANPRFLPQQLGDSATTTNRTIDVLQQVAAAPSNSVDAAGIDRALGIVSNTDLLRKNTASWKEFQPRVGFAWDPTGSGKFVIRGGYGIARDQVFQNLTLFALQQSQPTIYQTIIDQKSTAGPLAPGGCVGQLCSFAFGVTPLPAPAPGITDIAFGAFGRINDPRITDPWAQQFSGGFSWQFSNQASFQVDYYHVLGTHEPRVLNINPTIGCGAAITAACPRGADTRFFDPAFVAAGLGAGRLEQTNMIGTNNRSRFDSLNFQIKKQMSRRFQGQASYVLSRSMSWGGQPTASYRGNSVAVTPEDQFLTGEFGPTLFDERHRVVLSGLVQLPAGFQITPLIQVASARPYSFRSGTDINGDGRSNIDRVCVGSTLADPIITPGCQQVQVNSLRGKPFMQVDLRTAKTFKFGERTALNLYWEFYNLFNRQNFCSDYQESASASNFNQPVGYCNVPGGFGPSFTGPLRSQYGLRFEF